MRLFFNSYLIFHIYLSPLYGSFRRSVTDEFPLSLLSIILKYPVPAFKNNIIVGCQLRVNNRNRTDISLDRNCFSFKLCWHMCIFLTSSHSWKEAQCTNLFFRHPLLFLVAGIRVQPNKPFTVPDEVLSFKRDLNSENFAIPQKREGFSSFNEFTLLVLTAR